MKTINSIMLSLFGAVLSSTQSFRDEKMEASLLAKYNVLINPNARHAVKEVHAFCLSERKTADQLNSTLHRSISSIISKSNYELLFDQIMHYMSTYGTNFTGQAYVPANAVPLLLSDEDQKMSLFVVAAISEEEAVSKTVKLLSSGVALKDETMRDALHLLDSLSALKASASQITNREAKIVMYENYGISTAFNPSDAVRYMVFKATESTLLIKNQNVFNKIVESKIDASKMFEDFGLISLATVFNRFKPIFLALKKANKKNVKGVNAISKLSKVHHKPMAENPLNNVDKSVFSDETVASLRDMPVSKILRAYNAAKVKSVHSMYSSYLIRNGKAWVKEEASKIVNYDRLSNAQKNAETLKELLIEKIGESFKGKKFLIPAGIEYGLPLSEKQMCGNIPRGTIVSASGKLFVGAFWDNGYNVRDLDVSGMSVSGRKFGWNGSRYDSNVIYSGDMTSPGANGAAELLLVRDGAANDVIEVVANKYAGYGYDSDEFRYDVVIGGRSTEEGFHGAAMVSLKDVVFSGKVMSTSRENRLGLLIIEDGKSKFVFDPAEKSNLRVSNSNVERQIAVSESIKHNIAYGVTLNDFIEALGGEIVTEAEENVVDLSPDKITKDFFNIIM